MKILFLSHYFPPEVNAPATRTYEHCRYWVERGHEVSVITSAPNAPSGRIYPGYRHRLYQQETLDGIHVHRIWTYLAANQGFSRRILNYLSYFLMSILMCWKAGRADVVISTSPQFFCGLAGYFVSRLKSAPWVLEIRDLWPESILAVGAMKQSFFTRCLYALETWAYRKATQIVVVTDAFKSYICKGNIKSEKVAVVKNGANLRRYNPDAVSKAAIESFKSTHGLNSPFIIGYIGTHGMAHGLEVVLDAAEILIDQPQIQFLLVGDGAEKDHLFAEKNRRGLNNLHMLDQIPKAEMPLLWSSIQVALVHLIPSDTFKTVIPSKIFEAMAMKKPIILGVEGESQRLLMASDSGLCIKPSDSQALVKASLELYKDGNRLFELGENGRKFVTKAFDRDKLAEKYLSLFKRITSSKTSPVLTDTLREQ